MTPSRPSVLTDPRGWAVAVVYARDGARRRAWANLDPVRALCDCGTTSPALGSSAELRRWLVEHEETPP